MKGKRMDNEQAVWLDEIDTLLKDTNLLEVDIDVEYDDDRQVYYIVSYGEKDTPQERIATIYVSPSNAYDAAAVGDLFTATPDVISTLLDMIQQPSDVIAAPKQNYGAVRFLIERALDELRSENASIDAAKSLLESVVFTMDAANDDAPVQPTQQIDASKNKRKTSLLELVPSSIQDMFSDNS